MTGSSSKQEYVPRSFMGGIIMEYVAMRRTEGLIYKAEYLVLKSFDRYLTDNGISSFAEISSDVIEDWNSHRSKAAEPKNYRYAVRDLLIYVNTQLHINVYIPPRIYRSFSKRKLVFSSAMGNQISSFIQFKRNNGYKYESEEGILGLFDDLCRRVGAESLTKELVILWSEKRECESDVYTCKRISIIRQFAEFLIGQGYEAYRAPEYPSPKHEPPHIFSDEELVAIFIEADRYRYKKWGMNISIPVVLRFYYGMGLRLNEALHLACKDVDLENGCVHIKAAKNLRDRDVYMSPDLLHVARLYDCRIREKVTNRAMFFISDILQSPIQGTTVCRIFNTIWHRTGYDAMQDKKPTIHSFRHTFVVRKMEEWYRERIDFSYYLPYLSAYLGHHSLKETYYYIHFVDSAFPDIRSTMSDFEHLYPEVRS